MDSKIKIIIGVGLVMLVISAVYFVRIKKTGVNSCRRDGCSGQLCVDINSSPQASTCEYQDSYRCYQQAKCEVQPNGKCGFTNDSQLINCLKKYK